MKKTTILLLFSVVLLSSVFAQSSEETKVAANVEAFRKAMIDADKSVLVNLTAQELSYGHSSAKIENKTDFLEVIISGKTDYKTIDLSDQTITIVDNIAIVRHNFNAEILSAGTMINLKLGVLQIWKKQQNKWKLLARQAYKL